MRLGIYIGSFNPVHLGHIKVVNYLLDNSIVDEILIVPTLNYWDKKDLIDVRNRIDMLKIYENEFIKVDSKHNQYIYTYELMRHLQNEYNDNLYLIIGADNIVNFDKWKNYKELLNYNIIVMNRGNVNIKEYIEKFESDKFIVIDNYPYLDVSGTEIRAGKKDDLLDERVLKYINDNKLYGK